MNMTRKNEVYVANQPQHAVISLIIVGDTWPLSENLHDNIFRLEEISDVVFVFSDKYFPGHKNIDKNKFANLYRACAWIESDESLSETIFKILKYSEAIFQKHVGYCFMNSWDIEQKLTQDTLDNIVKATSSDLYKPIFKLYRLSNEELWNIYKIEPHESIEYNKTSILRKFLKLDKYNKPTDNSNMFSTYSSKSDILLLKKQVINTLINFDNTDELGISKTFITNDIRFLLASLVKYLGIDNINCSIENLKLGKDF